MPRKIYTPEKIIRKLREAEVLIAEGMTTRNASYKVWVTEQTYYRWRKEYGGMKVNQAKRLKAYGSTIGNVFDFAHSIEITYRVMILFRHVPTIAEVFACWQL